MTVRGPVRISESGRILHSVSEDKRDRIVAFDHDTTGKGPGIGAASYDGSVEARISSQKNRAFENGCKSGVTHADFHDAPDDYNFRMG